MTMTTSSDFDGAGHDHRPAMTSTETDVRALIGVALNNAFVSVEHGQVRDGSFRPSLRGACVAARHHGLQAEQFILIVKGAWAEQWQARVLSRQQAAFALERVVTVCIEEFYRRDNDESLESDHERQRRQRDDAET